MKSGSYFAWQEAQNIEDKYDQYPEWDYDPEPDEGGEGCDLCGEMVSYLRWTQDGKYLVCEVCWSEYPSGRLTQD